jgi:hypothetical protein
VVVRRAYWQTVLLLYAASVHQLGLAAVRAALPDWHSVEVSMALPCWHMCQTRATVAVMQKFAPELRHLGWCGCEGSSGCRQRCQASRFDSFQGAWLSSVPLQCWLAWVQVLP